jgi:hypothetical protein
MMQPGAGGTDAMTQTIRWTARLWSLLTLGLVAGFLVGEPLPAVPAEWVGFVFFPAGVCAGMIVAWWNEGLGGRLTVVSLLVFSLVHFATAGTLPRGLAWAVFAAPGPLFLLCSYRSGRNGCGAPR